MTNFPQLIQKLLTVLKMVQISLYTDLQINLSNDSVQRTVVFAMRVTLYFKNALPWVSFELVKAWGATLLFNYICH